MASENTPSTPPSKSSPHAIDIFFSGLTYWYLTSLLVALGFSLGFHFFRPAQGEEATKHDWLKGFTSMDGSWYQQIASRGYEYVPDRKTNIAFYPVYPIVARAVMMATGWRAETALLIVSNLSLIAALAMLNLYISTRYPDGPVDLAEYTVLTAALFPTGCFFRFAYSESTFLLLALVAMYAMVRRWPLGAIAMVIGLATAARPVGAALLFPFAIHILRRADAGQPVNTPLSNRHLDKRFRRVIPHLRFGSVFARLALYLSIGCWGLGSFAAYQWIAFGDALAMARAQKNWGAPRL